MEGYDAITATTVQFCPFSSPWDLTVNWCHKWRLATKFILNGEVLYKRNHDMVLLRCVDAKEAELILKEVHEGTFGTHMNGHSIARKILRAGYFWLTMENDFCIHVRKCLKCQKYMDNINVSPTALNVLSAP